MANCCFFTMKIVGKKEDVEKFIKIIKCNYEYKEDGTYTGDYDKHFFRIFNNEILEQYEINDMNYNTIIAGNCAWSVYSCMTEGEGTYYSKLYPNKYKTHATTLKQESKNLNLKIEVFSEELGIGFEEHFLYKNGEELINSCVDYSSFYITEYETKEEAEEDLEIEFTDMEWEYAKENDEDIKRGGFIWKFSI